VDTKTFDSYINGSFLLYKMTEFTIVVLGEYYRKIELCERTSVNIIYIGAIKIKHLCFGYSSFFMKGI